ncbi:putative ABC transport system ATP-binding protein [Dethiosulfatibacter aminovorans DSM 17477]|uniref:Putative ABC transport system ATP-binding protein n=1 Tax=Dethiosulfatibacter aminovorans DSM 17477 TaxID=1121476 RepID=A0A1M6CZX2_9FIRM|nr:ABC transporter ATP-binding protein [Dethiosulfatibacter aminovorans]SHI66572.1 putative ABC transport system ATP-binding protein [Dethiosulfatibacter aminovorans DSM 17477]
MDVIKMNNIVKEYRIGEIRLNALKNIDLTIENGEFVSIMGPSGSGKSTLLNVIGCLDKCTEGSYILDGNSVEKLSDNKLSEIRNRFLGFVFQNFSLLPKLNSIKNVEIPLVYRGVNGKMRKEMAEEALIKVGLKDRMKHLPMQLSGGQQQRVAIARAIVGNPSVLLADEPTGALDTSTSKNIMELFLKLNEETELTIVQVTHEESIAEYGKRIIRLVDGEINRIDIN